MRQEAKVAGGRPEAGGYGAEAGGCSAKRATTASEAVYGSAEAGDGDLDWRWAASETRSDAEARKKRESNSRLRFRPTRRVSKSFVGFFTHLDRPAKRPNRIFRCFWTEPGLNTRHP